MFRIYDNDGYPVLHEFTSKDEAEQYIKNQAEGRWEQGENFVRNLFPSAGDADIKKMCVERIMAEYQILTLEEVSEIGEGYELGLLKPFDYWVPTE